MGDKFYLTGTTVRLTGEFKDSEGRPKDPTLVKIVFYNYRYDKLHEVSIGTSNRLDVGKYFYDYTVPYDEQRIIFEWYGEIDGNPALERDGFQTKFIK